MEIILGIAILALVAYVFTRKKDVAEANAEAPYKVEVQPAGTEAAVVAGASAEAVVVVPDAVAPAAVVGAAPAKKPRAKKPAAAKAPAKPKTPKAK